MYKLGFAVLLLLPGCSTILYAQQSAVDAGKSTPVTRQEPANPVLLPRPSAKPALTPGVVTQEGRIQLDVVATDAAGKPAIGLQPWDFSILDNNQPRKVMTFRAFDGVEVKPDPPVEVLLVIDTLNLPFQQVAFVRDQVEEFLRENGGHLRQPVSLVLLAEAGIRMQPRPSVDGNAQAEVVHQIKGHVSSINPAMGGDGMLERFRISLHQLSSIAENEARRPGRKLLVWVGPGWPMLDRRVDGDPTSSQRNNFDGIVELSTRLREARMALYSVQPEQDGQIHATAYQMFLKGVRTSHDAESGNLALKVLATQTGGLILGPDNNVAGQIDRCIDDANAFYRVSFQPAGRGARGRVSRVESAGEQVRRDGADEHGVLRPAAKQLRGRRDSATERQLSLSGEGELTSISTLPTIKEDISIFFPA